MKLKRSKTGRGFEIIEFDDSYGVKCTLQKSSLATDDAIWLGVHDAKPKAMAAHADALGLKTDERTGWVEYPLPREVFIGSRMHLTRKQVKKLLPILQRFVETGETS